MKEFDEKLPPVGSIFEGRYLIHKTTEHTDDGHSYIAEDLWHRKAVFLTILDHEQMDQIRTIACMQQNSRVMARCNHSNILTMTDFGMSTEGNAFFARELKDGITLDEFLIGRGALEFEEALPLISQLCDALEHAHSKGILLRELKPEAIFLCVEHDSIIKLSNFSNAMMREIVDDDLSLL